MKYFSHLNTAVQLLQQYKGEQPFAAFIKQFFQLNKKYGSKDRKNIAHLCYACFRLGKALQELPIEERILTGLHLCSPQPAELVQHLKPVQNNSFPVTDIFPWKDELSAQTDHEYFAASFLTQPDLFIRIRPGKEQAVRSKLQQAAILFQEITPSCLALPNASKLDTVIDIDKEAVIQDYSSQRIGEFLNQAHKPHTVWDACAASGGKSILAYDLLSPSELTVSDLRKSILINLEKRFAAAGIGRYHSFVADLSVATAKSHSYDLVLADVPCSGSGTWSRTPEQLVYFDPAEIDRYSALQKKILRNIIPSVKRGGNLLYITCSVFKKENEEAVSFIQEQGLQLQKMALLKGYDLKADTLFGALFTAG